MKEMDGVSVTDCAVVAEGEEVACFELHEASSDNRQIPNDRYTFG